MIDTLLELVLYEKNEERRLDILTEVGLNTTNPRLLHATEAVRAWLCGDEEKENLESLLEKFVDCEINQERAELAMEILE